jgi:hypothetical protein
LSLRTTPDDSLNSAVSAMLARHTSERVTKVSTVSYLTVPDDACRFGEASYKGSLKPWKT